MNDVEEQAHDRTGKHIPMTNPEGALAILDQKKGHSVSWVELEDGRILCAGGGFSYSEDGGLTWSEPFEAQEEGGGEMRHGGSLVRLSGKSIGTAYTRPREDGLGHYDRRAFFRTSKDEGRTWSKEIAINPAGPTSQALQDVLLRTSSGRLILPVYMSIGQGNWHHEEMPFLGGYINGSFISTDTHFYDPHFTASLVFYSDDEGRTWQRNRDGDIFIITDDESRSYEWACEPSVTEVTPGKLLMIFRTRLGRHYQSWSYDNGETWTRPQATQLAGVQTPAQIRTFRDTGHLFCVFNQHSEEETRQGYVRTRLSSAISRNGGGVWEHFQNVESIHETTHVEPSPPKVIRPEGRYPMSEFAASGCDPRYVVGLPPGHGSWSYPSVLVLKDRVLISHTYSWYDEAGIRRGAGGSRLKVLPISWFFGGQDPSQESEILTKIGDVAPQP